MPVAIETIRWRRNDRLTFSENELVSTWQLVSNAYILRTASRELVIDRIIQPVHVS